MSGRRIGDGVRIVRILVPFTLVLGNACGDDTPSEEPFVPADYATSFVEVRDCRRSTDHDLMYIRVLANATAENVYLTREGPFPEGSILVKEEHANADCDDLDGYTAMRMEAPGYDAAANDWHFQRVDLDFQVDNRDEEPERCVSCHSGCDAADGYDFTCAVEDGGG